MKIHLFCSHLIAVLGTVMCYALWQDAIDRWANPNDRASVVAMFVLVLVVCVWLITQMCKDLIKTAKQKGKDEVTAKQVRSM